jgi:hypothetical protein
MGEDSINVSCMLVPMTILECVHSTAGLVQYSLGASQYTQHRQQVVGSAPYVDNVHDNTSSTRAVH